MGAAYENVPMHFVLLPWFSSENAIQLRYSEYSRHVVDGRIHVLFLEFPSYL